MTHTLEEAGLKAKYPVAYYIGAGIVGRSYLVRIGEYLFQSLRIIRTRMAGI